MGNYIWQVGIFIGSVLVIILAGIDLIKEIKKPDKNYWRIIAEIFVLCMMTIVGAWGQMFTDVTVNGEFSNRKANIALKGASENICLMPKYKVHNMISLNIKDAWAALHPETHYELQDGNIVFVKFIYGENIETNRGLAEHGLMFTYKTKLFLFDLVYIQYCIENKKVLNEET